jgi:hypothetical protein
MKQIVNTGRGGRRPGQAGGSFTGVPVSGSTDGTPGGQEILPTQERAVSGTQMSGGGSPKWTYSKTKENDIGDV